MSATQSSSKTLYPWLVWFLAACFFFYKYLLQLSPSVMTSDLMRAFDVTGAGLGNLAACYFYVYLFMQIPAGILIDRYNPIYIAMAAITACALGAFAFGHATLLPLAGLSRGLIGLGAAFAPVVCFKLISVWFPPRRFALLAGMSMTIAMFGAVNGCAPLSALVGAEGWRHAMTLLALPGLAIAGLFLLVSNHKPTQLQAPQHHHSPLAGLGHILKNRQTWFLSFYSGFAYAPFSVLGGLWGVPFLESAHHLSPTLAAAKVSYMFVGFALGSPFLGWLSDSIGERRKVIVYSTLISLAAILAILYLPINNPNLMGLLMLIFGIGTSGFLLCFSMVREVNTLILAGTAIGFMNAFDSLWEAISEPVIGHLLDLGWTGQLQNGARLFSPNDYHTALSLLPVYLVLALICLLFVEETHGVQKM